MWHRLIAFVRTILFRWLFIPNVLHQTETPKTEVISSANKNKVIWKELEF